MINIRLNKKKSLEKETKLWLPRDLDMSSGLVKKLSVGHDNFVLAT